MRQTRAFTLVEILVVVLLLGILAAIVIPSVAKSSTMARESALASDLSLLRRFVLIYKSHHLEVSPGYPNGNTAATPTGDVFVAQATQASNGNGATAAPGTPGYNYGPYLSRIPANPLNDRDTILVLADGEAFPVTADGRYGWVFKPETGEIRPDNIGTGSRGTAYYDY